MTPWRLTLEGADASVVPVPGLFTEVTGLAPYAATCSGDVVPQLHIIVDVIGDNGRLRIDLEAMVHLCARGKAILDDIDRPGLPAQGPRSDRAASGPGCSSPEAG